MPQIDTTDDSDGAAMLNQDSLEAQAERKQKFKKGKKKVKKIISIIGKVVANTLIQVSC
jgi:hypothetical protein